jgi:hypothetical protein
MAPFTLTPSHRAEIARIFGETHEQAEAADGSIRTVESAVQDYLTSLEMFGEQGAGTLINADPASMKMHKNRAKKLIATIKTLQDLIHDCTNREDAIIDAIDFRSNILGALALSGPMKRKRLPLGEDDSAELLAFLQSGELALGSITQHLEHLATASKLWLDYCTGERGRPSDELGSLIRRLHRICYPWSPDQDAEDQSPAAPNSKLTRTLGVVMEALGRAPPLNIEQKIRRSLSAEDVELDAANRLYDYVQGFSDQK